MNKTASEEKKYEIDIEEFEAWVEENTLDNAPAEAEDRSDDIEEQYEDTEEDVLSRFRGDSTNRGVISRQSEFNIIIKLLSVIIVIVVVTMAIVKLKASPVVVVGISMEPTFYDGDVLRTTEVFDGTDISYDTIICWKKEKETIIKRVVGLPGDRISFRDGYIYINDTKREDNFPKMNDYPDTVITLGEDEYYCLGDNRNNSRDSRYYGPVKFEEITNVVISNMSETKRNYDEVIKTMDYLHSLTDATPADATPGTAEEE